MTENRVDHEALGHDDALTSLREATPTPILQLHPDLPDIPSRVLDGVVTITWPFSVVTRSIAFILAERDVQLRRNKGQVRIEFAGAAGKAVAEAGIGGGDDLRLSLAGAQLEQATAATLRTAVGSEWQIKFTERVFLEVKGLDATEPAVVEVVAADNAAVEEEIQPIVAIVEDTQLEAPPPQPTLPPSPLPPTPTFASKRAAADLLEPNEYSSPAFVKRARVSYGSLFEGGLDDIFGEDASRAKKKRRRSRFSFGPTAWRYTSESPEPGKDAISDAESPSVHNADERSDAQPSPTPAPKQSSMVDSGCQTQELDFGASFRVDVSAEARPLASAAPPLPMSFSPPPSQRHSIAELPNSLDDIGLSQHQSLQQGLYGSDIPLEPPRSTHSIVPSHSLDQPDMSTIYMNGHLEQNLHPTAVEDKDLFHDYSAAPGDEHNPYPELGLINHAGVSVVQPSMDFTDMAIDPSMSAELTEPSAVHEADAWAHPASPTPASAVPSQGTQENAYEILDSSSESGHSEDEAEPDDVAEEDEPEYGSSDVEDEDEEAEKGTDEQEPRDDSAEEDDGEEDTEEEDDYDQEEQDEDPEVEDEQSEQGDTDDMRVKPEENGREPDSRADDEETMEDSEISPLFDARSIDPHTLLEVGLRKDQLFAWPRGSSAVTWQRSNERNGARHSPGDDEQLQLPGNEDADSEEDEADEVPEDEEDATNSNAEMGSYDDEEGDFYEDEHSEAEATDEQPTQPPRHSEPEVIDLLSDSDDDEAEVARFTAEANIYGRDELMGEGSDDELLDEEGNGTPPLDSDNEEYNLGDVEEDVQAADEGASSESEQQGEARSPLPDTPNSPPGEDVEGEEQDSADAEDEPGNNDLRQREFVAATEETEVVEPRLGRSTSESLMNKSLKANGAEEPVQDRQSSKPEGSIEPDPEEPSSTSKSTAKGQEPTEAEPLEATATTSNPRTNQGDNGMTSGRSQPLASESETLSEPTKPQGTPVNSMDGQIEHVENEQSSEADKKLPSEEVAIPPRSLAASPSLTKGPERDVVMEVVIPSPSQDTIASSKAVGNQDEYVVMAEENQAQLQVPKPELKIAESASQAPAVEPEAGGEADDYEADDLDLLLSPESSMDVDEVALVVGSDSTFAHAAGRSPQLSGVHAPFESIESQVPTHSALTVELQTHAPSTPSQQLPPLVQGDEDHPKPQEQDDAEDMMGAEDQILSELQEYEASHLKSPAPGSAAEQTDVLEAIDDGPISTRTRAKSKEPEVLITAQSHRSRGHRKSTSTDTPRHEDPSILLANAPEPVARPSSQRGTTPQPIIRANRTRKGSRADQVDPGMQLAMASSPTSTRSAKSHRHGGTPETMTRETRARSRSFRQAEEPKSPMSTRSFAGTEDGSTTASSKSQLVTLLHSSLPDYIPLKSLRGAIGKTADFAVISATDPPKPYRPKVGPRDYTLELVVTDASLPATQVCAVHIYRPHAASLPSVHGGDVLLLREFQVVSIKNLGFGLKATNSSSWAVYEKDYEFPSQDDGDVPLPQIKGPPIEIREEESQYVAELRRWWASLGEKTLNKIDAVGKKVLSGGAAAAEDQDS